MPSPSPAPIAVPPIHSRLLSLLEYVRQTARMRVPVASDLADHGGFVLHDHQLGASAAALRPAAREGGDEIWLSVPRPGGPRLPPEPDSAWLAPWLLMGTSILEAPRLAPTIDGAALIEAGTHRDAREAAVDVTGTARPAVAPDARIGLATYEYRDEVQRQYRHYLDAAWSAWSAGEQLRRGGSRLHGQLLALQQELAGSRADEELELVWGVGLGTWEDDHGRTTYPLVTQLVDLAIDPATGAAEIRPREGEPRLELDPYARRHNAGVPRAEQAAREWLDHATTTFSPFDAATWQPLLDIARRCLDPREQHQHAGFVPLDLGVAEPVARFTIAEGWVLFTRPRSTDPLVQDVEKLAEALQRQAGATLPSAAAALVTEPGAEAVTVTLPAFRGVSQARPEGNAAEVQDLFFPKPFNDEQVRVVQLLEAHDGVVVQGPPGTGKTHTIANIICHWLATGRRVLVTSMKEPALAVLRDKLPGEIRPLAIALLAGEKEGLRQFEQSVRAIATEVQSADPAALARDAQTIEETIDALQSRLARIDVDIGRWARLNLSRIELGGERIDALDAAREVQAAAGRFEFIPDPLGVGPQYAPRFSARDVERLRAARRRLGPDIAHAGTTLPAAGDLPGTDAILAAHRDIARFAQLSQQARDGAIPTLGGGAGGLDALQALLERLAAVRAAHADAARHEQRWSATVHGWLARGERREELALLDRLGADFEQMTTQRRVFQSRPVEMPAGSELDADFVQAVHNLAEGRRAFGFAAVFGKGDAKKQVEAVRVSGLLPADAQEWQHVAAFLAMQRKWRELAARWNTLARDLGLDTIDVEGANAGPSAAAQMAAYRRLVALDAAARGLAAQAAIVFPDWAATQRRYDEPALWDELDRAVAHYLATSRLSDAWAVRERFRQVLGPCRGRLADQMREFLDRQLGDPARTERDVIVTWNALTGELARLDALAEALAVVAQVTEAVEESGAPRYAQKLREPPASPDDPLLPEHWAEAWRLRRLDSHLSMIDAQDEFRKLARLRSEIERDLARAYGEAVVKRTWQRILEQATPEVCAALQGYLNAIERIATDTGRRTARHRREAREAAARAQPAVPCWIMPHYRVSESLPPELGTFDLVVVDEASQSDLSALPALLRGRKVLVVGDDRQVAPEGPGLEEDEIRMLTQRYLADQVPVYRTQMAPDRSIYDLAKVVYARSGVLLREHFRCVAPIIEYSKREFYGDELRPLRLPTATERFDPPLVDVFVEGATRQGDVNEDEIDFIVEEVRRLATDPRTMGRSIGVVSLAGEAQAQRAWQRLHETLGAEVLERHQLACGDARGFQGRERDVILLTLVATPADVGPPQSRDAFAQRFNVAASRARDRMVLVRSVGLEHLPEADRLRRSLIAHFADPVHADSRGGEPRDRCGSALERTLYDWLTARGYRVLPQARVGSHLIDLVVEGEGDARLAIECDGDRHQGAETWVDDVRRQRVLERTGWTFWRCFASSMVRRPDAVLEDLATALAAAGVRPAGTTRPPSEAQTEHRRVRARAARAAAA